MRTKLWLGWGVGWWVAWGWVMERSLEEEEGKRVGW